MTPTDIRNDEVWTPRLAGWIAAFGCGLLTGATMGILFAPARGRDIRREIVWGTRQGRERALRLIARGRRAAERQRERAVELVHRAGQHAGEIKAGIARSRRSPNDDVHPGVAQPPGG